MVRLEWVREIKCKQVLATTYRTFRVLNSHTSVKKGKDRDNEKPVFYPKHARVQVNKQQPKTLWKVEVSNFSFLLLSKVLGKSDSPIEERHIELVFPKLLVT